MPNASVVKAVVRAVDRSGLTPPARGIDLSCGDGQVIEALAQRGFVMEGTHFRGDDYILRSPSPMLRTVTLHEGVDLTRSLPFPDATWDLVLATEVLEHLPSHAPIIAEVGRILRPGGVFICTTPNIHRLASRTRFFLTGVHEQCGARLGWQVPREALYSTHHNPVYFPVFHTLLFQNQMRILRLVPTRVRPGSCLLAALWPLLAVTAAVEARHFRKRSRDGGKDLLRWLVDIRLLTSDQLCIVARKAGTVSCVGCQRIQGAPRPDAAP